MSEDRKPRPYAESEITVTRSEDGLNIKNTTPWAWTSATTIPAKEAKVARNTIQSVIKFDIPAEPPAGTRLRDKAGYTVQRLHGIDSAERWQWYDLNGRPTSMLETWNAVLSGVLTDPNNDNELVYLAPRFTVGEKVDTITGLKMLPVSAIVSDATYGFYQCVESGDTSEWITFGAELPTCAEGLKLPVTIMWMPAVVEAEP